MTILLHVLFAICILTIFCLGTQVYIQRRDLAVMDQRLARVYAQYFATLGRAEYWEKVAVELGAQQMTPHLTAVHQEPVQ